MKRITTALHFILFSSVLVMLWEEYSTSTQGSFLTFQPPVVDPVPMAHFWTAIWLITHQKYAEAAGVNWRFFQKSLDKQAARIHRTEQDIEKMVANAYDEKDYRYQLRQRAEDVTVNLTNAMNKSVPEIDWDMLVEKYWRKADLAPSVTQQLEEFHHFRPIGRIASEMGFVHLQIPFNFTQSADQLLTTCRCEERIREDLNMTNRYNDHQIHESVIKGLSASTALGFACHDAKADIQELVRLFSLTPDPSASSDNLFVKHYDDITKHVGGRKRRQVLVGMAIAGIIGSVAGGIGGFNLASMFGGGSASEREMVHKINGHSHDLQLSIAHAKAQDKVLKALELETSELSVGEHRANLAHKVDTCRMHSDVMRTHFTKVQNGLRALYLHELPFEFLDVHVYEENLPGLEAALAKKDLQLVLRHPSDIYTMKTSWGVMNGELNVFVHIPVSPFDPFPLYKFIPTPFYSKHLDGYYIYDLDHEYLALEDSSAARFRTFSSMSDCTVSHEAVFICPGNNILMTSQANSCLMSIYSNAHEAAQKLCRIKKFPHNVDAFHLAPNDFAFFSRNKTQGDFECRGTGKMEKEHLDSAITQKLIHEGITIIEVPTHCTFRAAGVEMNSEEVQIEGKLLSVKVEPIFKDAMVVAYIRESNKNLEVGEMDIPELKIPGKDLEEISFVQTSSVQLSFALIVGILMCVLLGIIVYGFCKLRRLEKHAGSATNTNIVIGRDQITPAEKQRETVAESVPLETMRASDNSQPPMYPNLQPVRKMDHQC